MRLRFLGVRSATVAVVALCAIVAVASFDGRYAGAAATQLTVTRVEFQNPIPIALDADMIGAPVPLKLIQPPEWQDANADGAPEQIKPTAYAAGATVQARVTFNVDPVPNANINNVSITGDGGADWLRFHLNGQTLQAGQVDATFLFTANAPLPAGVGFSNLQPVSWTATGGDLAAAAGTTKHTLYVTLRNPLPTVEQSPPPFDYSAATASTAWLTLLQLSTGAKGQNADDTVTTGIWGAFHGGGPAPLFGPKNPTGTLPVDQAFSQFKLDPLTGQINPVRELTYYDPAQPNTYTAGCAVQSSAAMFTAPTSGDGKAHGECSTWAHMFRDAVLTQGIGQISVYVVVPIPLPFFFPKNYDVVNDVPMEGVPGQGNPEPPAEFGNHVVTCYAAQNGQQWYDPSYGNGPFAGQQALEEASFDGFTDRFEPPPPPRTTKINDPTKQETNFTATHGADICPAGAVGGIAGLLDPAADEPSSAAGGSSASPLAPIAAAAAAGAVALVAGGWYARRRWVR